MILAIAPQGLDFDTRFGCGGMACGGFRKRHPHPEYRLRLGDTEIAT